MSSAFLNAASALISISARYQDDQYPAPHPMDLNAPCSPVCPGLQRAHVLFQAAGLLIKAFHWRYRSPPVRPRPHHRNAAAAPYAICSAVTLRNWRAIAISPDVGSVVSFPKASATLSTSTPDAEAKRATLDGIKLFTTTHRHSRGCQ